MKTKRVVVIGAALLAWIGAAAVSAQSAWARNYGGGSFEEATSVEATSDGGYVFTGDTTSFGHGDDDVWVVKLDGAGAIQWQKAYGGSDEEFAWSIIQTSDHGYLLCGSIQSSGNIDLWLLKLTVNGDIEWQRAYGGSGLDQARSVQQTVDGGFIVAGVSSSYGAGVNDVWILKMSSSGNIQWQRAYGGAYNDGVSSIEQTSDGGYIVAGFTGVTVSTYNAWVAKLDASGNVQWERVYGTVANQVAQAIHQTPDGGYAAAVEDVDSATNTYDFVMLKLDSSGNIVWQYRYYGGGNDDPWSMQLTADNGFILAGRTTSFGSGSFDVWAVKLNASGVVQWQKTFGGTGFDGALFIRQTPDGGFVLAGNWDTDVLILKLDSAGAVSPSCTLESDSLGSSAVSSFFAAGNVSTVTSTVTTVTTTTATAIDTTAIAQELCGPPCNFCDDFDDNVLASDWSYLKPAWTESNGDLIATPARKAVAVASPAFAGCGANCTFEAGMKTGGGAANAVWMLAWYTDKNNTLEVLMKEENGKFVMKQKSGGSVVAKTKGLKALTPNVTYNVRVTFDGSAFTLVVDGQTLAVMPAAAVPNGTVGFQAKNTTARFDHVRVE